MSKGEDFKLLKIQTCVLKVNIHCDGCKQQVKKLLQRIEGVFKVNIDAEQQKVTVSGTVDSATLIRKLIRSGKHAELWSPKSNQNQKQLHCINDDKNNKDQKQGPFKGLKTFKDQHKFPAFSSEEDEFDCEDDDDDFEEGLRLLQEKASRLGLLNQQANGVTNAKKNGAGIINNNVKINNAGNRSAGKKGGGGGGGNPNQNMGMKATAGGVDQKNIAAARMNNALLGGGGNMNAGENRKGNDINTMTGLAGLHGHGGGVGLGGNGLGFQTQLNNGFQGSSTGFPAGGFATGGQHPSPMMMQGYQLNHPSTVMNMNMQNRQNFNYLMMNEARYMQPQMMYHRSPIIPPSTGYYYNYSPDPDPSSHTESSGVSSAAHMFNDENTNSCVVM